jgi:hypothetical protein
VNKPFAALLATLDTMSALNRRPRAFVRKYTKFFKASYSEYKESE